MMRMRLPEVVESILSLLAMTVRRTIGEGFKDGGSN